MRGSWYIPVVVFAVAFVIFLSCLAVICYCRRKQLHETAQPAGVQTYDNTNTYNNINGQHYYSNSGGTPPTDYNYASPHPGGGYYDSYGPQSPGQPGYGGGGGVPPSHMPIVPLGAPGAATTMQGIPMTESGPMPSPQPAPANPYGQGAQYCQSSGKDVGKGS